MNCEQCGYEAADIDDAVVHVENNETHSFTVDTGDSIITISMGD